MSKAIWIGGPRNGQVADIDPGRHSVRFVERDHPSAWHFRADHNDYPLSLLSFTEGVAQVFRLTLATGRTIIAVRHPEISEDTARRYLADLVIGAWEKSLADTRNG